MKTGKYRAYIQRLDNTTELIYANYHKKEARDTATLWIRNHPTEFSEHDTLLIVKEVERIDVTLVIMGA